MKKEFMELALIEAQKAYRKNEVPIGAVIVKENKVISKAYNKKIKNKTPLAHAEIIAITNAAKKLKDWRLNNCEMYVTLEPCEMCNKIINETRLDKVYYLIKSNYSKQIKEVIKEQMFDRESENADKYGELLALFFQNKR